MQSFTSLGLAPHLLQAIDQMGFTSPTDIQQKAIPILLESDTDMVALAQTGTGKTAAFGFPLLQKIDTSQKKVQGLIIAPTRELCLQITSELKKYAQHMNQVSVVAVYGGASVREQADQIKRGAHIVVATPGRLIDLIERRMLSIDAINYCILDEADEMLNMGFYQDIKQILSHTPSHKRTWLFSATMPKEVAEIAREFMNKPVEITVGSKNEGTNTVSHFYYQVTSRTRYPVLKRLVDSDPQLFAVVFCRTKIETQKIAERLIEDGYNAGALHGDLSQNQRDLVMAGFRKRQLQILIATDVAARGIDVDDITHVIHYQMPDDAETYTHRSGRTGRAGKTGFSYCLVTSSDRQKISGFQKRLKQPFKEGSVPTVEEIIENQLQKHAEKLVNVTVHEQLEAYLPELQISLKKLTKEELIKKVFSEVFNRLQAYYHEGANSRSNSMTEDTPNKSFKLQDEVRFFINLGERDGLDWRSLKDFLRENLQLDKEEVFKVDVLKNFSFFNVSADLSERVLGLLPGKPYGGHTINVEITEDSPKNKKSKEPRHGTKTSRNFSHNTKKARTNRPRKGFY
jgi:ATP-dependent RNA helicase DeaD